MKVQEYLRSGKTPQDLQAEYGISFNVSKEGNLVILNYDQVDSSKYKTNDIVRECRGLVLENNTWDIVSCNFRRFFNYGEAPEIHSSFDWEKAIYLEKLDGSLILLYHYDGEWRVNTRNSFAEGKPSDLCDLSWRDLFLSTINKNALGSLMKNATYAFELCTPYNKVVKYHPVAHSYLLSTFAWSELPQFTTKTFSDMLGIATPKEYNFNDFESLVKYVGEQPFDFEGFVLFDGKERIKVKNPLYVAVHHLKGNGGEKLTSIKNVVDLVISGEHKEVKVYYPEFSPIIDRVEAEYANLEKLLTEAWQENRHLSPKKNFALAIKDVPLNGILFNCYNKKGSVSVKDSMLFSKNYIIEYIKNKM